MLGKLNELAAFACVARKRSFRQAAQELQVTASALSHSIAKLEQALGVRLLNRSTRSVSPSAAGERLLQRLVPALSEIEQALDSLNALRARPSGKLRLNVPRAAAQLVLAEKIAGFVLAYPEIQLEIVASDALIDIVEEGYDAGIRFGESLQQDMIALPVGPAIRFVVCGAPAYLERHGKPRTPHELLGHACIQLRFPSGMHYRWEFSQGENKVEVATNGALILDEPSLMIQAALDGAGLIYMYETFVRQWVQQGRLEYVLEDWCPAVPGFYLYYPSGRNMSAALRALIDYLKAPPMPAET